MRYNMSDEHEHDLYDDDTDWDGEDWNYEANMD